MLVKMIVKNYRANGKQYFAFFLTNVISLAVFFLFWGMLEAFLKPGMGSFFMEISGELMISVGMVTVVTILMMFYSLKSYIQYRLQDYTMMLVLGMRKKRFLKMLALEYFGSCILSFLGALVLGNLLLAGVTFGLRNTFLPDMPYMGGNMRVWLLTVVTGVVLAVVIFAALATWLENKDAGNLMQASRKNSSYPQSRWWLGMAVLGIVMTIIGCSLYRKLWWYWFYAHFIWIAALGLVLLPVGGLLLNWLRKKQFYFRHLLRLNTLYSRYLGSFGTIFTMAVVHFVVLGFGGTLIAGRLPLEPGRDSYPYSYIWFARETDSTFAREVTAKYDGELFTVPVVRVTVPVSTEWTGISQSDYEKMSGAEISLSGQETLVSVADRRLEARRILPREPQDIYLYPGRYTQEHEQEILKDTIPGNFGEENTFRQVACVSENLLGDYSGAVYAESALSVMDSERIVVFSDAYFSRMHQELAEDEEEPVTLYAFRFPEETQMAAGEELGRYYEENGLKTEPGAELSQKNFYSTEEALEFVEHNNTFFLFYGIVFAAYLFLCILLLYGVKLLSDFQAFQRKYQVLDSLGMRWKEQKKSIRGEIMADTWIALAAALPFALVYTWCSIQTSLDYGRKPWSGYLLVWGILAAGYVVFTCCVSEGIAKCMQHLLRKRG